MKYLTIEEIIILHNVQIKRFGGSYGLRETNLLESAAFRPQTVFGGKEMFDSVAAKAAVLLQGIIKNHPFVDGNKRTGVYAAMVFLRMNGYKLQITKDEGLRFALRVAKSEINLDEITRFITGNIVYLR